MNVVFISPHFPEYYHNFCSRLKDRGVNVLGVGDCPYDMISDDTKNSLTEYYYVGSLENYDEGSAELHYDELVEIWEYYKKL